MGPVPAGTVAGVAGAAARPRASARRASLAGLGGIAGRARGGPGGEETAAEGPAELRRAFYSAGPRGLFISGGQAEEPKPLPKDETPSF